MKRYMKKTRKKTKKTGRAGYNVWKKMQMLINIDMYSSTQARTALSMSGLASRSVAFEKNRNMEDLSLEARQGELKKRALRRAKRARNLIIDNLTTLFAGYDAKGTAVQKLSIEECIRLKHFPATQNDKFSEELGDVARCVLASMENFEVRIEKKNIDEMMTTYVLGDDEQASGSYDS